MIDVGHLEFAYTKRRPLFEDLELHLELGSVCGLLGKNGAGKTTLLRIISGSIFPHRGTSRVFGYESQYRRPQMLWDISFVPEEFSLPELSVGRYVATRAPFYPRFSTATLTDALEMLQVPEDGPLKSMSYGQKKKFLIAFAVATGARLVLLDEPTNGLDIPSKSQLRKLLIANASPERCLLISTHQVRDLSAILDPIIILDEGKILTSVDVDTLSSRLVCRLQREHPSAGSVLWQERVPGGYQVLEANDGTQRSEIDIELLFNAVIQEPERILPLLGREA